MDYVTHRLLTFFADYKQIMILRRQASGVLILMMTTLQSGEVKAGRAITSMPFNILKTRGHRG